MRDFSETTAAQTVTEDDFYGETNWLSAYDAKQYTLIVLSANFGNTREYGEKCFLHVSIEDDTEAVEYTISFTPRSMVFAQIKEMLDTEGAEAFPFRAVITDVGKTYRLSGAPKRQSARTAASAGPERKPINPRPALPKSKGGDIGPEETPF